MKDFILFPFRQTSSIEPLNKNRENSHAHHERVTTYLPTERPSGKVRANEELDKKVKYSECGKIESTENMEGKHDT